MKNAMLQILAIFIGLSSFFYGFACAEEKSANGLPQKQEDFSALTLTETTAAGAVIDGLRFSLTPAGGETEPRIIQLSGIHIPGIDSRPPSPVSVEAAALLATFLEGGRNVLLYRTKNTGKGRMNRMGHHLAHAVRADDGLWLQGALLEAGLAYALPSGRNPEMAAPMYKREQLARQQKKGLWADGRYTVHTPDNAARRKGRFAFVQGTVEAVAETHSRTYLNFGADWKTDFTISIAKAMTAAMKKDGFDFPALEGKTVRVRGWVEDWNGPHIKLDNPELLEVLPDTAQGFMLSGED